MATISDLYLENALPQKTKFPYGSSAGRDEHGYSLRVGEVLVRPINQAALAPEVILGYGVPEGVLRGMGLTPIYEEEMVQIQRYIMTMEDGEDVGCYIVPPGYEFAIVTMEKVVYPKGVMGTLWNKSSVPYTLRSPLVDGGFEGHLTLRGTNTSEFARLVIPEGTGCMVLVLQDDPNQTVSYDGSEYSTNKRFDNG